MEYINYLREFNTASIIVRLTIAMILGGIIGIERERKRRPAGFRTHMITCLGAALTMLTSQYLVISGFNTDIGRLGAQVVAGIGFIGAGTILVTHQRKVRGLTTAAGFWSSAVIGLAVGAGYYEGALIATVLILAAEILFEHIEMMLFTKSRDTTLMIEYSGENTIVGIMSSLRSSGIRITGLEISKRISTQNVLKTTAIITLRISRRTDISELSVRISDIGDVLSVEKLQ